MTTIYLLEVVEAYECAIKIAPFDTLESAQGCLSELVGKVHQ